MPFNITPEFVQGLLDQLKQANEQKQALISQIEALTKLVEELRQTIKELEARLNKNPRNSSMPLHPKAMKSQIQKATVSRPEKSLAGRTDTRGTA